MSDRLQRRAEVSKQFGHDEDGMVGEIASLRQQLEAVKRERDAMRTLAQDKDSAYVREMGARLDAERARDEARAQVAQVWRDAERVRARAERSERERDILKDQRDKWAAVADDRGAARDEAVGLLRRYEGNRIGWAKTGYDEAMAFLSRLSTEGEPTPPCDYHSEYDAECDWCVKHRASTEGEPTEDRCPTCGRPCDALNYDVSENLRVRRCSDPWHTIPKEDRP